MKETEDWWNILLLNDLCSNDEQAMLIFFAVEWIWFALTESYSQCGFHALINWL